MNQLSTDERTQIVSALVEGNSMRAIARMTGVSRNTIDKLLCDLGRACSEYQDKVFHNLKSKRVQCDEVWSFCHAKEKNCTPEMKKKGAGDVWTWVAFDSRYQTRSVLVHWPTRCGMRVSLHARSCGTPCASRATDNRRP